MKFRNGMLAWTAVVITIASAMAVFPSSANAFQTGTPPNLTGTYSGNDGGVYYVQQSGTTLWWTGMSLDSGLAADKVWHRGLSFSNVFRGTISGDYTVSGDWADTTRGSILQSGTLKLSISYFNGKLRLTVLSQSGGFGGTTLTQTDPLDDTKWGGLSMDIIDRFDAVSKNDGSTVHDNLKPFRDQTVVFGRLVTSHIEYLEDDKPVEQEIPHVNFGSPFSPSIPHYLDFGLFDRSFNAFATSSDTGDADFDIRIKIDQDKLEPDFYTTGWGNRSDGPTVYNMKLNDSSTHQKLGYGGGDAYLGAETIMFGRDSSGTNIYLPGWSETGGNSVLINGESINGPTSTPNPSTYCNFVQPCPFLDMETPQQLQFNYLQAPVGIGLQNLVLAASGNGQVNPFGVVDSGDGTYVRITGALILDCGHFNVSVDEFGHDCFDDPGDGADTSTVQNQEIHPVYSIDVINYPFRPEDLSVVARPNLTGTYAGNEGSTYYVRQVGNTIWWLGMMRDRQPIQRGTNFAMIGENQLASAFQANDPPCSSNQCWAFANVFKGTLTVSPSETVIEGDWAGVPQSTAAGSSGGHMKFFVFNNKIIIPSTSSIFPVTIQKMYEPRDKTAPQSALSVGSPKFTANSTLFVTGATSFSVSASDVDSSVQNIWYRDFLQGSTAPAYTALLGSSGTFKLSGADGLYEVDSFSTDPAGNDEAKHTTSAYLDNTAPLTTISAPTATQYVHSDNFTISYSVDDGNGSGVKSAIASIDGKATISDGTNTYTITNGLVINVLTELALGTHTFTVVSTDNLNNTRNTTVTFSVVVTADSIKQDVSQFVASGKINVDDGNSLLGILNAAAAARAAGDCGTAARLYQAFITQVTALSGKKIAPAAAQIMIADAQYLIAHCP